MSNSGIFRFYFASCCDVGQDDEDDIDVISNPVFEPIEAEDEEGNFIDDEGTVSVCITGVMQTADHA